MLYTREELVGSFSAILILRLRQGFVGLDSQGESAMDLKELSPGL